MRASFTGRNLRWAVDDDRGPGARLGYSVASGARADAVRWGAHALAAHYRRHARQSVRADARRQFPSRPGDPANGSRHPAGLPGRAPRDAVGNGRTDAPRLQGQHGAHVTGHRLGII
eukprot:scaffold4659_cov125-Isochrysis_galbana.AAC.2